MKNFILKTLAIITLIFLGVLITSCNKSKEELTKSVQKDIYFEFSKRDPSFKILNLSLVHVEGNKYQGVLKCEIYGAYKGYDIFVTTDGDNHIYHWSPRD